jgi:hypothetical protein
VLTACSEDELPEGGCRDDADCAAGTACVPPEQGERVCGGAGCPEQQCSADLDCVTQGLGDICVAIEGIRLCRPGCGEEHPCAPSEACNALRCEPKACAGDGECPANFGCSPNVCVRRFCDDDSPCDGTCVLGQCYGAAGTCQAPIP